MENKIKNPRCQFELKVIFNKQIMLDAYGWCVENLPLKPERGIIFQVDEIYIITRSQRIIDKVNKEFGSDFSFNPFVNQYFIDKWKTILK